MPQFGYQFMGNIKFLYPEIILSGTLLVLILLDIIFKKRAKWLLVSVSIIGLAVSLYSVNQHAYGQTTLMFGAVVFDRTAAFFKTLFAIVGILSVVILMSSSEVDDEHIGEYLVLLFGATVGMYLLASANDLVMFFLAFETVSLPSYALSGLARNSERSREAALKYLIFGAVSSGIMLFGIVMLAGMLGSTNFEALRDAYSRSAFTPGSMLVIVGLIVAGLAFKISAVPFHMWAPDVYEGSPTPVTAFFSVAPKAAGFAAVLRLFYTIFNSDQNMSVGFINSPEWYVLWGALSVVTMTLGNLAAIPQNNIKRLLAYSSISHVGYMLIGFMVTTSEGIVSILFYLSIYAIMNIGAFYIAILFRESIGTEDINEYKGIGWRMPFLSVAFAVFLLSLVGIPPFAGFAAKLVLFASAIHRGFYLIVLIAVLNSVVSLYYYAGIIRKMFLEQPDKIAVLRKPAGGFLPYFIVLILLAPIIVIGINWNLLFKWILHIVGAM